MHAARSMILLICKLVVAGTDEILDELDVVRTDTANNLAAATALLKVNLTNTVEAASEAFAGRINVLTTSVERLTNEAAVEALIDTMLKRDDSILFRALNAKLDAAYYRSLDKVRQIVNEEAGIPPYAWLA